MILQKQRDTLKESAFKYMVKEVRYEILKLLEKMGKAVKVDSQKSKDGMHHFANSTRKFELSVLQMLNETCLWCLVKQ